MLLGEPVALRVLQAGARRSANGVRVGNGSALEYSKDLGHRATGGVFVAPDPRGAQVHPRADVAGEAIVT